LLVEAGGAAAVGAHAGQQIGRDGDVTGGGELVSDFLRPIGEAEDLVDDEDDGCFAFDFGIGDERFDRATVVFGGDELTMAR
jgi:hypothetical protein